MHDRLHACIGYKVYTSTNNNAKQFADTVSRRHRISRFRAGYSAMYHGPIFKLCVSLNFMKLRLGILWCFSSKNWVYIYLERSTCSSTLQVIILCIYIYILKCNYKFSKVFLSSPATWMRPVYQTVCTFTFHEIPHTCNPFLFQVSNYQIAHLKKIRKAV